MHRGNPEKRRTTIFLDDEKNPCEPPGKRTRTQEGPVHVSIEKNTDLSFIHAKEYIHTKIRLKEKIVREFFVNLFQINKHKILTRWGKYPPLLGESEVSIHFQFVSSDILCQKNRSFQFMLETILYRRIEFSVTPQYIQLFSDRPTFNISRDMLDEDSCTFLDMLANATNRHEFFLQVSEDVKQDKMVYRLRNFYFNHVLEDTIDRLDLLLTVLYKLLIVTLEKDESKRLFRNTKRFIITILNLVVASQYHVFILDRGSKKEKEPGQENGSKIAYLEELVAIIDYLKGDEDRLVEKLYKNVNTYFSNV